MRRNHLLVALFCLFLMFILPQVALAQAHKERLCVLDLDATHGVEQSLAEALSMIVRDEIHSHGDYAVMSREDLAAVASREQLLQAMGCDEGSNCLVDFGKAIGSRFMVAGAISKIGSTYTVNLRMLDTQGENAGLVNRVSQRCRCSEDDLIDTVQEVAAQLIGKDKKVQRVEKSKVEVEAAKTAAESQKSEAERQRLAAEVNALNKQQAQDRMQVSTTLAAATRKKSGGAEGTESTMGRFRDTYTGMEFVLVKGGCYQMGDTFGDGADDEQPVHEVCVGDFYLGKYEVTQGEWQKVMGNNPSHLQRGSNYPVEKVSWYDTQRFFGKLNSLSGKSYRLPTEAEWEYAARSGGQNEKYSGSADSDGVAWYRGNSNGTTQPVGKKSANALGLHDMSGNVWEWCSDWYTEDYYRTSQRDNPSGPSSGRLRVGRGGGWDGSQEGVRAANRYGFGSGLVTDNLGFRLVLPVP